MEATPAENDPAARCDTCEACCCRLEVMLMAEDDIPGEFTARDRWGGWVMRREDGRCAALLGHRCGIYAIRPRVCRDFAEGGADCLAERALAMGPGGS
ncbi:MAG: YkgJ family cysteine cluster protein [Rhodocyclaceae bacterium]|nr:YkgJ family cysteine cluster protein [Rhodocyclaceae bacterium]